MTKVWTLDGALILEDGVAILCDECPCGEEVEDTGTGSTGTGTTGTGTTGTGTTGTGTTGTGTTGTGTTGTGTTGTGTTGTGTTGTGSDEDTGTGTTGTGTTGTGTTSTGTGTSDTGTGSDEDEIYSWYCLYEPDTGTGSTGTGTTGTGTGSGTGSSIATDCCENDTPTPLTATLTPGGGCTSCGFPGSVTLTYDVASDSWIGGGSNDGSCAEVEVTMKCQSGTWVMGLGAISSQVNASTVSCDPFEATFDFILDTAIGDPCTGTLSITVTE